MENFHLSFVYSFNAGRLLPIKARESCLARRDASELGEKDAKSHFK